MDAAQARLEDFGKALTVALAAADLEQGDLAAELDVSEEAVRLWVTGQREPGRTTVFTIEELLGRKAGELSRLLGYLPPSARASSSVLDAIEADPGLSAEARRILKAVYRAARKSP